MLASFIGLLVNKLTLREFYTLRHWTLRNRHVHAADALEAIAYFAELSL